MWRKEDVLKKITEDKGGQSLRAYAASVGCSHVFISDVLNSRREPSQKLLDRIGLEKQVTKTITYKPKRKWRKDE